MSEGNSQPVIADGSSTPPIDARENRNSRSDAAAGPSTAAGRASRHKPDRSGVAKGPSVFPLLQPEERAAAKAAAKKLEKKKKNAAEVPKEVVPTMRLMKSKASARKAGEFNQYVPAVRETL